ncbi:hypothetical protein A3K62_01365 [Candidatus Pacearchaeota archaeon RBG_16_35_8]|nr:MAG: hypothetical protein A3K62_01365 [Candidatus Pacearchaeota archaeon RBG_16_35_8]
MKKVKHVFWETILILSSVLVFRSMWLLMDEVSLFYKVSVLATTLIIGLVVCGIAYYRMAHTN